MITVADYFKGWPALRTPELEGNADGLIEKVNALRAEAAADGVAFKRNPVTGTFISGERNGGIRPRDSKVGSDKSTHKDGHGVDSADVDRRFASWCMAHPERLVAYGLHMEDPRWTPTWVHLQDVPPKSGKVIYIPSAAPALADWPPEWEG